MIMIQVSAAITQLQRAFSNFKRSEEQFETFQKLIVGLQEDPRAFPGIEITDGTGKATIKFAGREYLVAPVLRDSKRYLRFYGVKTGLPGSDDTLLHEYALDWTGKVLNLELAPGEDDVMIHDGLGSSRIVLSILAEHAGV